MARTKVTTAMLTDLAVTTAKIADDAVTAAKIAWSALAMCEFRLTLTTVTPVTTSDVTGATTIYCSPFKGNQIALFDGTNWNVRASAEFSLALGTLTSGLPYDVFCYDNAGTPTLEFLAWTNGTTRATALALQNGVLSKTGALTRRYLGTFYTTATTTTEDSFAKRYLWNYYNRVLRPMQVVEGTDSWAYSTDTYQQANASTANQLNFVIGVSEDVVSANVAAFVASSGVTNRRVAVAVGLDSTTVLSGIAMQIETTTVRRFAVASYKNFPGIGKHFLAWLERGAGIDTQTWYGDDGGTVSQSGINGELLG